MKKAGRHVSAADWHAAEVRQAAEDAKKQGKPHPAVDSVDSRQALQREWERASEETSQRTSEVKRRTEHRSELARRDLEVTGLHFEDGRITGQVINHSRTRSYRWIELGWNFRYASDGADGPEGWQIRKRLGPGETWVINNGDFADYAESKWAGIGNVKLALSSTEKDEKWKAIAAARAARLFDEYQNRYGVPPTQPQ